MIKNAKTLSTSAERRRALAMLEAGFQAIQLRTVLRTQLQRSGSLLHIQNTTIDLNRFRRIGVIGIGKCALEAGKYLEDIMGGRISGGILLDVKQGKTKILTSIAGTHPLPSRANKRAAERIVHFAQTLDPATDLLLCIVSGGGSSLFFLPDGISAPDMARLTHDLHKSGASIRELNCVRKHLSAVQGGKFAKLLYPLPIVALYFSDVIAQTGNRALRTIASGPFLPDASVPQDAKRVLEKYGLWHAYKPRIHHWSKTIPANNRKYFSRIAQFLLLENQTMLDAMAQRARALGLKPTILTRSFTGQSDSAFAKLKAMAARAPGFDVYLAGGETTVAVRGTGKGGRNQQAALAALRGINPGELFISAASDGIDNTPYAGAIADARTRMHAERRGLDARAYQARNDSFRFFQKTKDFIQTGKTGSNVADVMLYMKKG